MKHAYDRRQLLALCFVSLLAPATRLIPHYSTALAGSASWLAPIAAFLPLLLYIYFISAFLAYRRSGEGLGEVVLRAGGPVAGRTALFFAAALQVFFSGFYLISGADRFTSTIYPASSNAPFVAVTLLLALVAALGPDKAIVRSARIFAPIISGALILVLVFAFIDADYSLVKPLSSHDAVPLCRGIFPVVDVFVSILVFPAFLEHGCKLENGRFKAFALWAVPVLLLLSALTAAVVFNYGEHLTTELARPFFTLIRDVTLFRTIERIEALIAALWVVPDFVVLTVMLKGAGRCLRLAFGFKPEAEAKRSFDLSNGRWLIALSALAALAAACLLPTQENELALFSEYIVPCLNLSFALIVLPLIFLIGKASHRLAR